MTNEGTIIYQDQAISWISLLVGGVSMAGAILVAVQGLQGQAEGKNPLVGFLVCLVVSLVFLSTVRVRLVLREDRLQVKSGLSSYETLFVGIKDLAVVAVSKKMRDSRESTEIRVPSMQEPVTARFGSGVPRRWRGASHAILVIDKDERLSYFFPHPDAEKIVSLAKQHIKKSPSA